jgi:hypothetical protein
MKMPEPIIDPTTSAVEEKRPRLWTSLGAPAVSERASEMGVGPEIVT